MLITWCWKNTSKRCYRCGLQSPPFWLPESIAFWLTWQNMHPANLQTQHAQELAPRIHTVYSRTQLSMVPLWFSDLHKRTTTVTLLFICLLQWFQHTVYFNFIMIQSALGFCFLLFSLKEWNWQIIKCIFSANAQEHKCPSATGIWILKKYIERDCCVVNSCHLYVLNLCVSIFVVTVELAVIFCSKMDLIFHWRDYGCHIAADFWNCYKRCWEIFLCLYSINF